MIHVVSRELHVSPGARPRPKPGPYRGDAIITEGERGLHLAAEAQSGSSP
jgi:hypothetical protein